MNDWLSHRYDTQIKDHCYSHIQGNTHEHSTQWPHWSTHMWQHKDLSHINTQVTDIDKHNDLRRTQTYHMKQITTMTSILNNHYTNDTKTQWPHMNITQVINKHNVPNNSFIMIMLNQILNKCQSSSWIGWWLWNVININEKMQAC